MRDPSHSTSARYAENDVKSAVDYVARVRVSPCRWKLYQILWERLPLADDHQRTCQRRTANSAAKTVAPSISRAMTQPWKKLIGSLRRAT